MSRKPPDDDGYKYSKAKHVHDAAYSGLLKRIDDTAASGRFYVDIGQYMFPDVQRKLELDGFKVSIDPDGRHVVRW